MNSTFIKLIMFLALFNSLFQIKGQATSNIYQFTATSIDGKSIDFKTFEGHKIIIVNTASKCGFTPQFKDLQAIYDLYKEKGLIIIGFPTNDFANQDPDDNKGINEFCQRNYGVSFLMMEKINVKGENKHPIFKWLGSKSENGVSNARVKWNFQKFLINEKGEFVKSINPWIKPKGKKIINWLNS